MLTDAGLNFSDELHKHGRLQLADQAAMLQDQIENLATHREIVRAHHRQTLGAAFNDDGDDMGNIVLGDIVTNYAPPAPAMPSSTHSSPLGAMAKAGIVAALLGSGASLGVGIPLVLDMLHRMKPPSVSSPASPTTRGVFELGHDK